MQGHSGMARHTAASLSAERWREVLAAADHAIELGEEERRAFLQQCSRGDPALGSAVAALLGVKLLDFGIAKLLWLAPARGGGA